MIKRCTVIFGNGLGMALDSNYFSLETALYHVWENTDNLTQDDKNLIIGAIKNTTQETPPKSEEQLDNLQVAIYAAEYLSNLEFNGLSWISEAAKNIPKAFKLFIHEVALYFHFSGHFLPIEFINNFSSFTAATKSHVATLNYDNLLYDSLIGSKVMDGYNGDLIDGFWSSGFHHEHLDRHDMASLGWYLHLHGSPLFVGNRKLMRADKIFMSADQDHHIVLSHVQHKPFIISSSPILTEYWIRLDRAFQESGTIIVFGYSGLDEHLNLKIRSNNTKKIIIIEWTGAGSQTGREKYWSNLLGRNDLIYYQLNNILEFKDWPM